jgi:threonine dehydrogenase-like Zn-dependent dehydrogenase
VFPTGYMAAESCAIDRGDTIAVFGAGPVGQLAIRSAFLLGAERVIAIDAVSERLALAADGGAIIVDERRGNVAARLSELTGGRGPDACIDAHGPTTHGGLYDRVKHVLRPGDRTLALRDAILACRKGGTVSIAGVHGGFVDRFPIGIAFAKGLTLRMGQTHFHRYKRTCLDAVRTGALDPSVVITHRVTLAELPEAYAMLQARRDGCIKVVARP